MLVAAEQTRGQGANVEMLQCDPTSKQMAQQTKKTLLSVVCKYVGDEEEKKHCEDVGVDALPSVFLMISFKKLG